MGTEYLVLEKDGFKLTVDEMSCKMDIDIQHTAAQTWATFPNLTPEELVAVGTEFIKIASYQIGEEETQKAIDKHIAAMGGWRVGVKV